MPPIKSSLSNYYNRLVTIILSLSEVMPSCSRYADKKLVCVAIAAPSGCQPSFYAECMKLNMRSSCNIQSISNAKCALFLCDCLSFYF